MWDSKKENYRGIWTKFLKDFDDEADVHYGLLWGLAFSDFHWYYHKLTEYPHCKFPMEIKDQNIAPG